MYYVSYLAAVVMFSSLCRRMELTTYIVVGMIPRTNQLAPPSQQPIINTSNRKYQAPKRRGDPQPALNNHGLPLVVNVTSLQIPCQHINMYNTM